MQLNFKLLLVLCLLFCSKAFAQTPTGSLGDPVVQEDFGSGDTPSYPITSYPLAPGSCPAQGQYTIAKSEGDCHPTWHTLTKDHTGNDGYMMIIDAKDGPGEFYSKETAPLLCGGTYYEFSAYVKNLVLPAYASSHVRPNLTFRIETIDHLLIGTPLNTGPIEETADPNDWRKVSQIVQIPAGIDRVVVKIINNSAGVVGNDLVLDDITFRAYGPTIQADFGDSDASTLQNLCVGQAGSYNIHASVSEITPTTRFQWQQNDGSGWVNVPLNGNAQNYSPQPITDAQLGTYQYRLGIAEGDNINSPHCRVYSNPVTIKVSDYPHPPDLGPAKFCESTQLVILASGGATYRWTGGNLPAAGVFMNPLVIDNVSLADAGQYHVEVISEAGCSTTQPVTVTVVPKPSAAPTVIEPLICEGDGTSINANASGAIKYSWSPAVGLSNPNVPNPVASPTETTTYTLTVTNANDCENYGAVTVNVNKKPVVSAGNNKAIFEGQSVMLKGSISGDFTGFSWSPITNIDNPELITPTVTPTDDITYTLTAKSVVCGEVESKVFVRVYKKIIVPNSFSPNGDGINDIWNIEALFTYPQSTTSIFDRNGQQIFFSRGYSKPWDGTRNGSNLPVGTYYYVIDLKNGTPQLKGWLMLIR